MYTLINIGSHTSSKYGHGVTSLSLDMILAALPVAWQTSLAGVALFTNNNNTNALYNNPATFAPFKTCDEDSRHGVFMTGNPELTFILAFSRSLADLRRFGLEQLAQRLRQDCIACAEFDYYDGTFIGGKLVGPYAEAWGNFNPEYFLDLMGKPIA